VGSPGGFLGIWVSWGPEIHSYLMFGVNAGIIIYGCLANKIKLKTGSMNSNTLAIIVVTSSVSAEPEAAQKHTVWRHLALLPYECLWAPSSVIAGCCHEPCLICSNAT
jgi:hypothetical protein